MTKIVATIVVCICSTVLSIMAETVTANSEPFSFPAFTSVKTERLHSSSLYFRSIRHGGTVTLAWAFPKPSETGKGVISFYSLNGQKVREFLISTVSGSAQWKASKEGFSGVAVARVSYGSYSKTFKLAVW